MAAEAGLPHGALLLMRKGSPHENTCRVRGFKTTETFPLANFCYLIHTDNQGQAIIVMALKMATLSMI